MLSPSYLPRPKSPRSLNIDLELQKARDRELAQKSPQTEKISATPNKLSVSDDNDQPSISPRSFFEIYKTLATKELSPEAQYRLAEIFLIGENPESGFYYMKLAAEQKHRLATCRVAELLAYGIGVAKDEVSALSYFQGAEDISSDHSFPRALIHLGVMKYMGKGTEHDPMAASADIRQAKRSHFNQHKGTPYEKTPFGQDTGEMAFYLKPPKVLPTALYLLSKKYALKKNNKFRDYLNQAANVGHPLSILLRKPLTDIVETDLAPLIRDANDGCADSAFFLGQLYCGITDNIQMDISKAISYFEMALKAKHPLAQSKLDELRTSKAIRSDIQ